MTNKLTTYVQQVEYILTKYKDTRNSDIELYQQLLITYYRGCLLKHWKYYYIKFDMMKEIPSFSTIERIRRKFNAQWLFLPTLQEVIVARKYNAWVFKWFFSKDLLSNN